MLYRERKEYQAAFYITFQEHLSHKHPLYILGNKTQWQVFEDAFDKLYFGEGRPAEPIRLMVSLLMLKHIRNLSDESVVEQWMENIYYQYFGGEKAYASGVPCAASEVVHFRNRIGEAGIELILKESIGINSRGGNENEAVVDTMVQEKNITYPMDAKLHRKMIYKCVAIAEDQDIELRQSYRCTVKNWDWIGVFDIILRITRKPGKVSGK